MTIKKLKSIDIINVLSDLVSEKMETTVKLPGERLLCTQEVSGSIPLSSTIKNVRKYKVLLFFIIYGIKKLIFLIDG